MNLNSDQMINILYYRVGGRRGVGWAGIGVIGSYFFVKATPLKGTRIFSSCMCRYSTSMSTNPFLPSLAKPARHCTRCCKWSQLDRIQVLTRLLRWFDFSQEWFLQIPLRTGGVIEDGTNLCAHRAENTRYLLLIGNLMRPVLLGIVVTCLWRFL